MLLLPSGVLWEAPSVPETFRESPVANYVRPQLPQDVVLLPLDPPAHQATTFDSEQQNNNNYIHTNYILQNNNHCSDN